MYRILEAMLETYRHKNLTWVDAEKPTQEEVRELMDRYHIDPLIADELLLPTLKPRVETYENCIYLILHFPALKHTHGGSRNQEIDFIIGKDFIITTRYDTIDPLHKFSKVFEVNSVLDKSDIGNHAGYVAYYMLRKLYKSVEHELEYLEDALELIETDIFAGMEKDMVIALSQVGRDLLNVRQALSAHQEVLQSFEDVGKDFFGDPFARYLRSITGEYYRIRHEVRKLSDTLDELRETNNSLLFTKQNEVMKVIAIMAFVTFPLALFSSLFGMNTQTLPLTGFEGDFWVIVGIMAFITFLFFLFFKKKKWL